MAIEIDALCDKPLNSFNEWTEATDHQGTVSRLDDLRPFEGLHGLMFDGESGDVFPPNRALATAREIERSLPKTR